MQYMLETIGFNIESCAMGQAAGAGRIELCANPAEGGTTPSMGFIKAARNLLGIDLFPIIRPRGGDFLYTSDEFGSMKTDVQLCKELGCDGVVIGILRPDGTVDKDRCRQLVQIAYPMGVTFHRAFDRAKDPLKALEDIVDIGCERILTSGQQPTAWEGIDLITALVAQADERILIMPGSGVRTDNIAALAEVTGAREFHSSARIIKESTMQFINPSMNEALQEVSLDEEEVRRMVALVQIRSNE